jgi:hypothetical protein
MLRTTLDQLRSFVDVEPGARGSKRAELRDVGQGGVIRAFSAFDLFLDELEAELTSWRDFSGTKQAGADVADAKLASGDDDDVDRVERFYQRLGGSRSRVSDVWAVYRYFRR